jgi:hypothetical protein
MLCSHSKRFCIVGVSNDLVCQFTVHLEIDTCQQNPGAPLHCILWYATFWNYNYVSRHISEDVQLPQISGTEKDYPGTYETMIDQTMIDPTNPNETKNINENSSEVTNFLIVTKCCSSLKNQIANAPLGCLGCRLAFFQAWFSVRLL